MELVEFNKVSKKFGKNIVLSDISFSLGTGRIIGLLGPNGSGKTTIMKLISKLIFPTEGKITYHEEIKTRTLIEEPTFYKTLSGLDNLKYLIASEKNVTNTDIDRAVTFFGMGEYIKRKTGQYSMGMRQRLSLCYATLGDANLLVLDEPLNGLDPLAIIEMRDKLRTLADERGACIFISSHILQDLQEICSDIIIVNKGKIIKTFELNNLSPKYEIKFFNSDNCDRAVKLIPKLIKEKADTARIEVNEVDISEIIIELSRENVKIIGLRRIDNELERIYREVIGDINA